MKLDLSDRQRQAVGAAVTIVAAAVIVCAVGFILWLLGAFVVRFSNVFLPLGVAAVAALVVRPYFEWLQHKLRLPKVVAIVALFLSLLLPLALFGWFFGALVVDQVTGLVSTAPQLWDRALEDARERWPEMVEFVEDQNLGVRLREAVEGREASIVEGLQSGVDKVWVLVKRVLGGIGTVLGWAVLPVYFAFFLMTEPKRLLAFDHMLPFLKKENRDNVVYLVNEFVDILVAFFRGQLVIAFLQGCLFALGFSLVGLRYGLVLGLALGFLNIIPYLGNIVGLAVAIPLALFQPGGGWQLLLAIAIVFTAVQMIEGYLLTPKIMGDRTGLHPVVIIIAIFFWGTALGGISGMILAIPLTAFLVVFWRLAKEKYIGEWL